MNTSKHLYLFPALLAAFIMTACQNNSVVVAGPTPFPEEYIPTVIALTAEAAGLVPVQTATEENATPISIESITDTVPTHLPTNPVNTTDATTEESVETPLPTEEILVKVTSAPEITIDDSTIPDAEIKIYRPGVLSKLSSPFRVVANLAPGPAPDYLVLVELLGEDGRLLVRKLVRASLPSGQTTVNFVTDIEFEIRGVSELGRLVISVEDEFGRMRDLASMQMILLAEGVSDVNVYGDLFTDIYIQQPIADVMVQSEALFVSGLARTEGDAALLLELVDEEGTVLGFGNATLIKSEESEYGLFVGEIAYSVQEQTWARLIIKAQGQRIPGITYIASIELLLAP